MICDKDYRITFTLFFIEMLITKKDQTAMLLFPVVSTALKQKNPFLPEIHLHIRLQTLA